MTDLVFLGFIAGILAGAIFALLGVMLAQEPKSKKSNESKNEHVHVKIHYDDID